MNRHAATLLISCAALLHSLAFLGCTHVPISNHLASTSATAVDGENLFRTIAQLAPNDSAAANEAHLVAQTALEATARLRREYAPISSANLNNLLIKTGLKKRGLCYHWTNDLLEHLEALNLRHFDLYWANSHFDSLLHEHSTVVVTARGQPFATGLILDGWRYGGRLYWVAVSADSPSFAWRAFTADELSKYRPGTRRPTP